MDETLIEKYGGPAPRYTSYPTAPHFTEAVSGETYGDWLRALGATDALSLYCHLPYCDSLCWFCGCHTKITRRYGPVADYLGTLTAEAALVAARLGRSVPVRHLHWGGGSPTLIAPGDFRRVTAALEAQFGFAADIEMAIEIDPRDVDPDRMNAYAAAGINRASIGVQDFDPSVQAAINRVQPYELTARAVNGLRAAGIERLNFDLMYGLPYQTVERVAASAELALALAPDRIALFGYAHVPWMKKHQRLIPEAALPSPRERFAQQQAAARVLTAAGFVRIGMDHFARPDDPLARAAENGALRRNFQGYTTDDAGVLVGLGASSIGSLPQGYVQNTPDIRAYGKAIGEGRLATCRGVALSREDRMRRNLIEELMCTFAADLPRHSIRLAREAPELLEDFIDDGLVEFSDGALRVTDAGQPFIRSICARFDAYLPRRTAKHSIAV